MVQCLIKDNTCKQAGKGKHVITGNYRAGRRQSQSSHTVDEKTAELPLLMGFSLCSNASESWTCARRWVLGLKVPLSLLNIHLREDKSVRKYHNCSSCLIPPVCAKFQAPKRLFTRQDAPCQLGSLAVGEGAWNSASTAPASSHAVLREQQGDGSS